ncbi:MAG: ATP-binding protein [Clostridiales bacterium]|nr:ATP-binding protein [Clostridiales bacterium]
MNITSGIIQTAKKVVIYGPEGIGKSTFAAQFPDPVFIDTEGSTKHMNVRRFDKPCSWEMLMQEVEYVISNNVCKTIVIDTADWAEKLCIDDICARYKKTGIEDFGYGNGYVYLMEQYGKLLNRLEDIVNAGINVVLNAHAVMRKFEQPDEMGAYDRWELKLTRKVAPIVKEWADILLFANYKTYAVSVDDKGTKHKAQGGKRVMYTAHHPCWDAKNRFGLAEELPFEYEQICNCIEANQVQTEDIPQNPPPEMTEEDFKEPEPVFDEKIPSERLVQLMKENSVTPLEIRKAVAYKGHFPQDTPISNYPPDYIDGVLIGAWGQVFEVIKNMRENYLF